MHSTSELWLEAREALDRVWFVQAVEETERTDLTLSLRLWIRSDLFVQVFLGELSGSLYMALLHGQRRIFGIDRESGEWHVHPFASPHLHQRLSAGLEPKPLLQFLARVEELLLQQQML